MGEMSWHSTKHGKVVDVLGDLRWFADEQNVHHLHERCCGKVWVFCERCDAKTCLCFVEDEQDLCNDCRYGLEWRWIGSRDQAIELLRQVRLQAALIPDPYTNCQSVISHATRLLQVLTTSSEVPPGLHPLAGKIVHGLSFELFVAEV